MKKFTIQDNSSHIDFWDCSSDPEYPHDIHIELIETPEAERGKGYARRLITEFQAKFCRDNVIGLICCPKDASIDFNKLVSFYESMGFEPGPGAEYMPYPLMIY